MSAQTTSDVIVIGAGAIGLTCAWRLAQSGCSVRLLDRARCGAGASAQALGACQPVPTNRTDRVASMHWESLLEYVKLAETLRDLTGIDIEYGRLGRVQVLRNADERQDAIEQVACADRAFAGWSVDTPQQLISDETAIELEPALRPLGFGAVLCQISAKLSISRFIEALRLACTDAGVHIHEQTTVRAIRRDHGRVTSVRTDDTEFATSAGVLCAGAWTSFVDASLGPSAHAAPVKGQAMLLRPPEQLLTRLVRSADTLLIPQRDGRIVLGSTTEPDAGFDERVTAGGVEELLSGATALVPDIANAEIESTWAGLRARSRDLAPDIGRVPGTENLFVATGHFKMGVGLAPVTATMICDLVHGRELDAQRASAVDPARHLSVADR